MFNALRREDPNQLVYLWETDNDEIVAWTMLDPRGAGIDPQIAPRARERWPDLERELNVWSEESLLELMKKRGSAAAYIETDAFADDVDRTEVLTRLGWVLQETEVTMLSRRSLQDLAEPDLPPGYRIRAVRGVEEAGPVSELHSAGFGSSWTPELYRQVMESPGYRAERELVVEAPDGALAGFCVTWPDSINRTGLFEPVAVHPDHRRLRLGSALMRAGMAEMSKLGMERAEVMYEVANAGSGRLYRGEGFEPLWRIQFFRKPVKH
jgi:ribosomal protein S18 acetylase RimI-like enzyme